MAIGQYLLVVILLLIAFVGLLLIPQTVQEIHLQKPPTTSSLFPADSSNRNSCEKIFDKLFAMSVSKYRKCVINKIMDSPWLDLVPATEKCLGETFWQLMDGRLLFNTDDVKAAIPPARVDSEGNAPDMVEVTIGIGNNIDAEKQLRMMVPHCKFHGADPSAAAGQVFKEQMGEYYEVAVSGVGGSFQSHIMENQAGSYKTKTVKMISFTEFLLNYTKTPKVDYLFMDNEGGEYDIFPHLLRGRDVEKSGIIICQIAAEMHGSVMGMPSLHYKHDDKLLPILKDSNFLPVFTIEGMGQVRAFYVNVGEPYCVNTFFKDKFCDM